MSKNNISIEDYVRERITELRLKRKEAESNLSTDIGHNPNYLYTMNRDKFCPSFETLKKICGHFDMTLSDFFANYQIKH